MTGTTVYRGTCVPITDLAIAQRYMEACAAGDQRTAIDIVVQQISSGERSQWWNGGEADDSRGAGGWWCTNEAMAWKYAYESMYDHPGIPVLFTAQESLAWEQYHEEDAAGTWWWHLPPGTPVNLTQAVAVIRPPSEAQSALESFAGQGQWATISEFSGTPRDGIEVPLPLGRLPRTAKLASVRAHLHIGALDPARFGQCYNLSLQYVKDHDDWILVHGLIGRPDSILKQGNPNPAPPIGHAWAISADNNTVWEPISNDTYPALYFMHLFGADEWVRYTQAEALVQTLRTSHWGPWDPAYIAAEERWRAAFLAWQQGQVQVTAKVASSEVIYRGMGVGAPNGRELPEDEARALRDLARTDPERAAEEILRRINEYSGGPIAGVWWSTRQESARGYAGGQVMEGWVDILLHATGAPRPGAWMELKPGTPITLIGMEVKGNDSAWTFIPLRNQAFTARSYTAKLGAALSMENMVSVAENVMAKSGLIGKRITLPEGHEDDPDYQAAIAPIIAWASGIAGRYVKVYTSAYSLRQEGNPFAFITGTGNICAQPTTNELTLLHELAHIVSGVKGHGQQFVRTAHRLYAEHLGAEAAEMFWRLMEPYMEGKTAKTAGTPSKLFHAAPKSARDSIAQHGLDWTVGNPDGHAPNGNFFHVTRAAIDDMMSDGLAATHDLYEVNVRGLGLHFEQDPYDTEAIYTPTTIPPERLRRVSCRAEAKTAALGDWGLDQLDLPAQARDGDCIEVSERIAAHLRARGEAAQVVDVWGWGDFMGQRVLAFAHRAVLVGGLIIDATATQFDPTLPPLMVMPRAEYEAKLGQATSTTVEVQGLTKTAGWEWEDFSLPGGWYRRDGSKVEVQGFHDDLALYMDAGWVRYRRRPTGAELNISFLGQLTPAQIEAILVDMKQYAMKTIFVDWKPEGENWGHPTPWRPFRSEGTLNDHAVFLRSLNTDQPLGKVGKTANSVEDRYGTRANVIGTPGQGDKIFYNRDTDTLIFTTELAPAGAPQLRSGTSNGAYLYYINGELSPGSGANAPTSQTVYNPLFIEALERLVDTFPEFGRRPLYESSAGDPYNTPARISSVWDFLRSVNEMRFEYATQHPGGVNIWASLHTGSQTRRLWRGLQVADATDEELEAIRRDPAGFARQHLNDPIGIHWTDDPSSAWNFSQGRDPEGWASESDGFDEDEGGIWTIGLVLEGEVAESDIVQPGTAEHDGYAFSDAILDYGIEREITVRGGTPVRLTSVTVTAVGENGADVDFHAGLGMTKLAWNTNGITLFHGTIGYYADQVLAEGLKPRNATGVANHWSATAISFDGRVYLSHSSRMTVSRSAILSARKVVTKKLYPLEELEDRLWAIRPDNYRGQGITPEYTALSEQIEAMRAQIEADPRLESVILSVTIPPSAWGNLEPDEDTRFFTEPTTEATGFPEWMSSLGSDAVVAYRGEIPTSWIKVQARGRAADQAGMYSPEGSDWRKAASLSTSAPLGE